MKYINDGLALLPERMDSPEARIVLLAIGLQESELTYRRQHAGGPARGLWQFEAGGVAGVLRHHATRDLAVRVCDTRGVQPVTHLVHAALADNDVLAAAFARLLLWTDPRPLPVVGDVADTWALYLRTWRPGAYTRGTSEQQVALRHKWDVNYVTAMDLL